MYESYPILITGLFRLYLYTLDECAVLLYGAVFVCVKKLDLDTTHGGGYLPFAPGSHSLPAAARLSVSLYLKNVKRAI